MLKNLFTWFVYSSKNSQKYALTLKGFIPFLVLLNIGDANTWNTTIDAIVDLVVQASTLVTGGVAVYGLLRKIYLSLPFVRG